MKCIKVVVEGVLKGLGYLGYVYIVAEELKIKGWGRYTEEGSAEIVAISDADTLMKFINKLRSHGTLAVVNSIHIEPCPQDLRIDLDSFNADLN
ncbi:MAG: acylphosphatase [Ignisphaera sp.]